MFVEGGAGKLREEEKAFFAVKNKDLYLNKIFTVKKDTPFSGHLLHNIFLILRLNKSDTEFKIPIVGFFFAHCFYCMEQQEDGLLMNRRH